MFLEFLSRSDLLLWPLVGLLIFVGVFVGVLVQLVLAGRRPDALAEINAMPLHDDEGSR